MNRRLNTILFLAVATLLNLVLMFGLFLLLLGLAGLLLPVRGDILGPLLWILMFGLSVLGGFFLYRLIYRLYRRRVSMEKYFEDFLFKD